MEFCALSTLNTMQKSTNLCVRNFKVIYSIVIIYPPDRLVIRKCKDTFISTPSTSKLIIYPFIRI